MPARRPVARKAAPAARRRSSTVNLRAINIRLKNKRQPINIVEGTLHNAVRVKKGKVTTTIRGL